MDQLEVADEAEDDERHGEDECLRLAGRQRVDGVGHHRRAGDGGEELVDEWERVALEHGPPGRALRAHEDELGAPLSEREEEREQCRADEEPRRDADVDGDRPGCRADHEQRRDDEHVDDHDVLEPQRVRGLEDDEREQARDRPWPERGRDPDRDRGEHTGEDEGGARAELTPGDRAAPLDRVQPVGIHVAHVVDEVGGARRGTVCGEGRERLEPAHSVAELGGEDDPGEEEQVLQPLSRTERHKRGAQWRAAARQLGDWTADGERPQPLSRVRAGHAESLTSVDQRLRDRRAGGREGRRQAEREAAALPDRRLELEAAAERMRELAGDREAEARAVVVARDERDEDPLLLLGPDARPAVGHADPDEAVDELGGPSCTVPPSGVQRNAFASRFVITCRTRSPSVTIVGVSGSSSSRNSISRRRASSPKLACARSTSTAMSTSCG